VCIAHSHVVLYPQKFDFAPAWLAQTFSYATLGNGIVAIAAGLLSRCDAHCTCVCALSLCGQQCCIELWLRGAVHGLARDTDRVRAGRVSIGNVAM
jgi:hypothetical protein